MVELHKLIERLERVIDLLIKAGNRKIVTDHIKLHSRTGRQDTRYGRILQFLLSEYHNTYANCYRQAVKFTEKELMIAGLWDRVCLLDLNKKQDY